MTTVASLNHEQRSQLLPQLQGWLSHPSRDAIQKSFTFADFNAAWGFMNRVALEAERLNHHPEWSNVWNRVEIVLTTHDAGGLSLLDVRMAERIDRLARSTASRDDNLAP